MADFDEYAGSEGTDFRTPCPFCGRKFIPESLERHKGPCQKSTAKKRKVFDSSKQRTIEGELNLKQLKQSQKKEVPVKKNNWRAKHQDFINSIRAAKNAQVAVASGGPLPPPPPPSINPDYVQCPHCSRRFNETAAERHIPFCKEQQKRLGNKPSPNPNAKAKQNARLQYQAPRPKSKHTSAAADPGAAPSGIRAPGYRSTGTVSSRAGRMGGSASSDSDYRQSPGTSRNSNQSVYGSSDDVDNYGRIPAPGSASGRALRTGRDARAYEEARKDAKMRRPPGGTMNKYGGGQNSPGSNKPGALRGPQRGYSQTSVGSRSQSNSSNAYSSPEQNYGSSESNGYYGGGSSAGRQGSAGARFCHECGTKYPVYTAKFCCECGVRRMTIS
ncbi:zinc finger C2HC domain-containing protein 1B-like [Liolophura sinensis]|uniref:zinc finger C2HC domain-containing protein 1B-like n=1 Tax=Liolophura sinensis TaxID=3198878 RepID=UPI003159379B